jgi:lipid-A-disaccharide synthase
VFIGVDAPDFNLGLEADLRAAGIKTVHFVCPSIWAWRAERVEKIRRSADHVLCIFPFEPELLASTALPRPTWGIRWPMSSPGCQTALVRAPQLGFAPDGDEVLAILPGSRSAEVQYIAPPFFSAAALIHQARPATKFIVPAVPLLQARIEQLVRSARAGGGRARRHRAVPHGAGGMRCTLIASGTATLEAALFKRPMVIGYHMHPLSWWLMRRKQAAALGGLAQHPVW